MEVGQEGGLVGGLRRVDGMIYDYVNKVHEGAWSWGTMTCMLERCNCVYLNIRRESRARQCIAASVQIHGLRCCSRFGF